MRLMEDDDLWLCVCGHVVILMSRRSWQLPVCLVKAARTASDPHPHVAHRGLFYMETVEVQRKISLKRDT